LFTMLEGLQNRLIAETAQAKDKAEQASDNFMRNIKIRYENGDFKNRQEVLDYIREAGKMPTDEQYDKLNQFMNDKDTGKGISVDEYMETIQGQLGVDNNLWRTWKPSMTVLLKEEIAKYKKENNGQSPSYNEIIQMGVDLATEKSTELIVKKGGLFSDDIKLYLSDVQVKKWGYTHYDVLQNLGFIRFYDEKGKYQDEYFTDVYNKIQAERSAGY